MSERDYEVGYSKPPTHSQFKKGQSGNPKGRPKGANNLANSLREAMARKLTVMENGKKRTMTVRDAVLHKLIECALNGKTSDQIRLLRRDGTTDA